MGLLKKKPTALEIYVKKQELKLESLMSRAGIFIKQEIIIDRIVEILSLFLRETPDKQMVINYYLGKDNKVQDFISTHLKKEFEYCTAYQLFESAEDIARSQINNGMEKF